ncbi:PAB-dependent poly-A-specific ribonuclease subunit PAN2 [Dentipellis sp. KUC8613]|nr:PAB-dependent poly-A-specific ribonuclease subunit PAN2 [Dentipellis sp. KUC8613]
MSATAYRPTAPITLQRDIASQPITALSFDPVSDTLWTGTNSGHVTAYYTPRGLRGVTFPVGGHLAVKKLLADENYVRACGVASEGVGSWSKGGVNKWYFRSPANVTTFSNINSTTKTLAAATSTPELVLLNSITGTVVRQTPLLSLTTQLHFSHTYLLSGSSDGYVRCHDPRTGLRREGGAESSVKAHASEIQGLQSSGNYLYTIGWGLRQSRPIPDPLVKLYDMRTMRPLPPVPFPAGPAFINVLPRRSSSIVVASHEGLVNIVDTSNPTNATEFYQLDTTSINSAAVSPTGAYLAFGDSDGLVHLLTAADEEGMLPFNGFEGQPVEWANTPEPLPEIEWTDRTPLSSIGLPYYSSMLLSSWTPQFEPSPLYSNVPAKIPPQVLSTMKYNDNIAYATLPRELKGRRNMVTTLPRKDQGRFRSGRFRQPDESMDTTFEPNEVPPRYRQVEIEYSKFGVEDFDFGFYNRTEFSGLETHILNSYTNPLVQVMHYITPIRRLARSHITTNCPREHCLLCELGFVVRMLEDARGTNCQASNFCKTVGVLAQSSNAIELIDYGRDSIDMDHSHMIQSFHRFLIDHLSSEGNTFPHNPVLLPSPNASPLSPAAAPITQLLGLDGKSIIVCQHCKAVRDKENMTHIVDLVYPRKGVGSDSSPRVDFESLLHASLVRQMSHKATCQTCKQFSNFESRRSIPSRDLPPFLALNANVFSEENLDVWQDSRKQTFLRPRVEIHGQQDGTDDPEAVTYELRSMIVKVVAKDKRSHLVAIIKVPEAERDNEHASPWFLFNDFVVHNITEEEALSFPGKWKVPTILYLERVSTRDKLDFTGLPDEIDTSILSHDTSISINRDLNAIKHEPLGPDELPRPGTLVAIDAEFVQMQQEETEYRSDGTKKVLRPARLSLARVSVLRGDGRKLGVPFIDDHIHTSEVIVDYLTEFSGIRFGDLDPHTSPYTLTPLKLVYKKLRLLVDRGCIFIGHGLSKDFRIINIFVPPEQVIDTVDLYFVKSRQRRLSLRFLSWFILGETIQTDTHDSIEDARSALMLYKAYHEFEEKGTFDEKLEELYREGKKYNWKPPAPDPPAASATAPALAQLNPFAMMRGNILQSAFTQGPWPTPGASAAANGMPTGGSVPNFFSPAPAPPGPGQGQGQYGARGPWAH